MSGFQEDVLRTRLSQLSVAKDSIETLSLWILHHRRYARRVVDIWKSVLDEAPAGERLKFLYLASDALLQSHKKFDEYVTAFQALLPDAFALTNSGPGESKTKKALTKILAIWEQRGVYGLDVLAQIRKAMATAPTPAVTQLKENEEVSEPPVDCAALLRDLAQAERGLAATLQLRDVVRALPQDIFSPERFLTLVDTRLLEEQADTVTKAGQAINELFNGASTLMRRHEALKADLERLMRQEQRAAAAVQKRIEASKLMAAQASTTRKELQLHLSNLPELDENSDMALPEELPSLEELIRSHGLAEISRAVEAAASHPSSEASATPGAEQAQAAEKPSPARKSWTLVSRRSSLLDSASKRARRASQGEPVPDAAAATTATDLPTASHTEKDPGVAVANPNLFAVWSEAPRK